MKKLFATLVLSIFALTWLHAERTAEAILIDDYAAPSWSEAYELRRLTTGVEVSGNKLTLNAESDSVIVTVKFASDKPQLFSFWYDFPNAKDKLDVHCDEALIYTLDAKNKYTYRINWTDYGESRPVYIPLEAGEHEVVFTATINNIVIWEVGIEDYSVFEAEIDEPGLLGNVILDTYENLSDVKCIKISGNLNDADITTLNLIKGNLRYLDLSETNITSISGSMFEALSYLPTIILPKQLKTIGNYAFYKCGITKIELPETLESIGEHAFGGSSIKIIEIPDGCSIGSYAFRGTYMLESVRLPKTMTSVPSNCFLQARALSDCVLHEGITQIEGGSFYRCQSYHPKFPSSLTRINDSAFDGCNSLGEKQDSLIIPTKCNTIEQSAFDCYSGATPGFTYAELPVTLYDNQSSRVFTSNIKTLKIKSPTVLTCRGDFIPHSDLTIQVPSFLVNAYKQSPTWVDVAVIEPFDPADEHYWCLYRNLTLYENQRFGNGAYLELSSACGELTIKGAQDMAIDTLHLNFSYSGNSYAKLINQCENISIGSKVVIEIYPLKPNRWIFCSVPFDTKVSYFTNSNPDAFCAVRYYDGQSRAANGTQGSWKDYDPEETIKAGTGFIFCSNVQDWWSIWSLDNESKQNVVTCYDVTTELKAWESENTADRSWNYIGNPYPCYFDIGQMDFTAPITVRSYGSNEDGSRDGYAALSPIDDLYALAPTQGFFVQAPEGVGSITFSAAGRQMTSEVTRPTSAPARNGALASRFLVDLTVSGFDESDRTRIVVNENATEGFNAQEDAGKFFSENASLQIYTIDDACYAINEAPLSVGGYKLGILSPAEGRYEIALTRNQTNRVTLYDSLTQETADITDKAYAFDCSEGVVDDRFTVFIEVETTSLETLGADSRIEIKAAQGVISVQGHNGDVTVYSVSGAEIASAHADGLTAISVPAGVYVVKAGSKVAKVAVK